MATGNGVCVHIVYVHRAISCTGPRGQTGTKPYKNYTEIIGKSCNFSAVAMFGPTQGGCMPLVQPLWGCRGMTAQYPCDFMVTARAASGNLAIAVRGPCDCPKSLQSTYDLFCHLKSCVFCTISTRPPRGAHAGIVQCHLRHVYGLRA